MGLTKTINGHQSPHTSAPFPSRQPFVWILRAQPYSLPWTPVQHSFWHLHRLGTTTSVWQCGSKPGPAPRKREVWYCSVMVVLKARVGSLAMAYESPSSLELGLGHALLASNGHSISVVRYTCGAASTYQFLSCGCWWVVAQSSNLLSGTDLFVASVGPWPSHFPTSTCEKLLVEREHFSGAPHLSRVNGNPCCCNITKYLILSVVLSAFSLTFSFRCFFDGTCLMYCISTVANSRGSQSSTEIIPTVIGHVRSDHRIEPLSYPWTRKPTRQSHAIAIINIDWTEPRPFRQ